MSFFGPSPNDARLPFGEQPSIDDSDVQEQIITAGAMCIFGALSAMEGEYQSSAITQGVLMRATTEFLADLERYGNRDIAVQYARLMVRTLNNWIESEIEGEP